jgi:hypothetical protein
MKSIVMIRNISGKLDSPLRNHIFFPSKVKTRGTWFNKTRTLTLGSLPNYRGSILLKIATGSNLHGNKYCDMSNYWITSQQIVTFGTSLNDSGAKSTVSKSKKNPIKSKISANNTPAKRLDEPNAAKRKGCIGDAKVAIYAPFFKSLSDYFSQEVIRGMISKTVDFHDSLIKNHGIKDGTKRFKDIFLYASGLLEFRNPSNPGWVKTSKVNRWPTVLAHLRPLFVFIKDNTMNDATATHVAEARRLFLILSKINRFLEDHQELNVENIKSTFKVSTEVYNGFEQFVINRLGKVISRLYKDERPDFTAIPFFGSSNGPNKLNKVESADAEASKLLDPTCELKEHFIKLAHETLNFSLVSYMESRASEHLNKMQENPEYKKKFKEVKLRKLTCIPDSGNKSRTIAISDYWTQSIFVPIEREVFRITRILYNNNIAFYGHSVGFDKLKSFPKPNELVSLDATEWTDNLPAGLQFIVLKYTFGQVIAECWLALAARCPWHLGDSPQTIRYGKGQGMGTKGSFAIAQLTNLLFLEWKLQEAYPSSRNFFLEVGDDMVIQDPDFKMKSEFESIGVPINVTKSKVATQWGSFVEFVSRNLWNGRDYSIISPSLLLKFRQQDYYSITLLNHLKERGLQYSLSDLLDLKSEHLKLEGLTKRANKHKSSKDNIILMASLLQYGKVATNLVDRPSTSLSSLTHDKIKHSLTQMLLLPLVKLYKHNKEKYTRDHRLAVEKLYVLTHQYRESGLTIWAFAQTENLPLESVKSLIAVSHINERINSRLSVGYQRYTLGQNVVPNLTVPWVLSPIQKEQVCINPRFIEYCFNLMIVVNEIVLDTKLISRLSLLDKANTNALLELMADLNRTLTTSVEYTTEGYVKAITYRTGKVTTTVSLDSLSEMIKTLGLELSISELKAMVATPWIDPSFGYLSENSNSKTLNESSLVKTDE